MTEKEFVIWFNGFVEACHDYQPTPKQWQQIKNELAKVTDKYQEERGDWWWGLYHPNGIQYPWQEPYYSNEPYKIGDQVPDPHPVTYKTDE